MYVQGHQAPKKLNSSMPIKSSVDMSLGFVKHLNTSLKSEKKASLPPKWVTSCLHCGAQMTHITKEMRSEVSITKPLRKIRAKIESFNHRNTWQFRSNFCQDLGASAENRGRHDSASCGLSSYGVVSGHTTVADRTVKD